MEKDFNEYKAQILEDSGKPLFGKDGALAPMIESIVNAALEGEMDAHLTQESRDSCNRRNGKMQKCIKAPVSDITVSKPRDRDSLFNPQFLKKRETMLSEGMADRIIGLYALGTSTRDISTWMEDTVGTSVSAETISSITDRVLPKLESWRNRTLDEVYPIVWPDAVHYKVMDDKNRVATRTVYNVLGLDREGHKDLLGMYVSKGGARPKSALSAGSTPSKALQEADCNSKFRLFGQAGGGQTSGSVCLLIYRTAE